MWNISWTNFWTEYWLSHVFFIKYVKGMDCFEDNSKLFSGEASKYDTVFHEMNWILFLEKHFRWESKLMKKLLQS